VRRLRRRLAAGRGPSRVREVGGYTLVELLISLSIMTAITAVLTALFVSGARAELELNRRVEAQQNATTAVDRMRREVHCASGVTVSGAHAITVTLPGHCPTATGGAESAVAYDVETVSSGRYRLRRAGIRIADYLTSDQVFAYTAPSESTRGLLNVDLRVNLTPDEGWREWRLKTDIVLRNTLRQ
jgi:type II secretory pathway pseudopilin PulG